MIEDITKDQWMVCASNRDRAKHPKDGKTIMVPGDLFRVHTYNSRYVYFLLPGNSVNYVHCDECTPWIPKENERVRVQSVWLASYYGDGALQRPGPHDKKPEIVLSPGDEIVVTKPAIDLSIIDNGKTVMVGNKGIYYLNNRTHYRDSFFLWLANIAPIDPWAQTPDSKICKCDLTTLMRSGCGCGAISKYSDPAF